MAQQTIRTQRNQGLGLFAGLVLVVGMVTHEASAQTSAGALPDSQIESNVLKALATAPELSTQNIQTTTVYGVVTLSGSATDEASRLKAENLVARVSGVKKVVDEMTLGSDQGAPQQDAMGQPANPSNSTDFGPVLQSDGTYTTAGQQAPQTQGPPPAHGQAGPPPADVQQSDAGYGAPAPANQQAYPAQPYPSQQYPSQQYPPRRPMYRQQGDYPQQARGPIQVGGRPVTVPPGSMLQIRINQGLSSRRAQPGMIFDGTVLNDIVAGGAIAIPRGAQVQGVVADAKKAGALKGKGELALQLTSLTLGGQVYSINSDTWFREGASKTGRTVGSAVALGAVGALFGAAVGGGAGAAVGAGVGGAAGVASSAASPGGNLIVPPEATLTFHLAQPTVVTTVSQQEMSRLAYAAGPNVGGPPVVRRQYPPAYYQPYPGYDPYYGPR